MKTWVRKSLKVGVLSAGFLLIGGAAAHAADTSNNFGIGSGNQVAVPVEAPVTVSGNAIGLLGGASASSSNGGSASGMITPNVGGTGGTSDNFGVGTGNQLLVPVQVPIDICGNAIGALGTAGASCGGSGDTGGRGTGTGTGTGSTGSGTGTTSTGTTGTTSTGTTGTTSTGAAASNAGSAVTNLVPTMKRHHGLAHHKAARASMHAAGESALNHANLHRAPMVGC